MSNLNHPNVMKLIGVCIDKQDTPYIVMPYMSLGSLLSYLRKNREELMVNDNNEENWETVNNIITKFYYVSLHFIFTTGTECSAKTTLNVSTSC